MANQYVNKVEVNGITIIDLTSDTVSAGSLAQGYTAHDKSGALITGTADIAEGAFVVNLSYNSSTQIYEPDCTYAEALAAYQAGRTIVFEATDGNGFAQPCYGSYVPNQSFFSYAVLAYYNDFSTTMKYDELGYIWTSSGTRLAGSEEYYANVVTYHTSSSEPTSSQGSDGDIWLVTE